MFQVHGGDKILLRDVNYFGRIIRRGSVFRVLSTTKDLYRLFENNDGIVMECPAIQVHFMSISEEFFVTVLAGAPELPVARVNSPQQLKAAIAALLDEHHEESRCDWSAKAVQQFFDRLRQLSAV